MRDSQEDDSFKGPFEQELAAREHTTIEAAKFEALYQSQCDQDLASVVSVRRSAIR